MTILPSLDAGTDADDGIGLVLHDLELGLRRVAERHIMTALRICTLQIADCTPAEIRAQLGLGQPEYRAAMQWLREAAPPA